MNKTTDLTHKDLLSCWNKLEYFTPFELDFQRNKYVELLPDAPLPWQAATKASDLFHKLEHTVYLGVFEYREMITFLKERFGDQNVPINSKQSKVVSASLKLDEKGSYIIGSFGLSCFPYGLTQLQSDQIDKKEWFSAFQAILIRITSSCAYIFNELVTTEGKAYGGVSNVLTHEDLDKLSQSILGELDWKKGLDFQQFSLIKEVPIKGTSWSPIEKGIIPTLFSKELEYVSEDLANSDTPLVLADYLKAGLNQIDHTLRIDINQQAKLLASTLQPHAYPDGCWPSSFKLSLMQQFAVNRIMDQLSATDSKGIYAVNGPPGTGKTTLIRDVMAANIVRKAKAQITFEDPKDAFEKIETYVTESGFRHYIYAPCAVISDFNMVVVSSNNGAVENISKDLPKKEEISPFQNQVSYFKSVAEKALATKENTTDHWGLISAVLGKSENKTRFFNDLQSSGEESLTAYLKNNRKASLHHWRATKAKFESKLAAVASEKHRLEWLRSEETPEGRRELGVNFADGAFWKAVDSDTSQKACPWYSDELRRLQSELFAAALEVNECFLLGAVTDTEAQSNIVATTLTAFFQYQSGQIKPTQAQKEALWSMFQQVVPVISSTFAALGYMFADIGKEQIPWLFIDEAGQALPSNAVGALWRSKRAVVIGDPMQIEPVNAIPFDLVTFMGEKYGLSKEHLGMQLSVQSLADRANIDGTMLGVDPESKTWIGTPLRVHRRCLEPMFSIANQIAYNNTMVMATKIKSTSLEMTTAFIHCEGKVEGKHFVSAQAAEVFRLVIHEFQRSTSIPSLFIISPFSEVVEKLKSFMMESDLPKVAQYDPKKIKRWIKSNIGTVHSFQGKEADGVILCLGLDKTKMSAATWVSEKPNLLNVALTRAKYRFVAIGDRDIWLQQLHVQELKDLNGIKESFQ